MKNHYLSPELEILAVELAAIVAQSTQTENLQEIPGAWDDISF